VREFVLAASNDKWPEVRALAASFLCELKPGKVPISVRIGPYRARRSPDQNKLLWALLTEVSQHVVVSGKKFSTEAWHEYLKGVLLGFDEILLPDGTTRQIPLSTAGLDVAEFSEYIERIYAWAASEHGVVL